MSRISPQKTALKGTKKKTGRRLGLVFLFLFVAATLVVGFYFMVLYPGAPQGNRQPPRQESVPQSALLYEEPALPHQAPPTSTQGKKPGEQTLPNRPMVAILIDDMGYRQDTGRALIALDLPLSFSFLPFTPFSEALQKQAQARGREILLHLPLEPMESKVDPGPGALTTAMDPATMQALFQQALQAVPQATGINNHMGSRFTANPQAMRILLPLVRARGLFFLDSLTTSHSVAYELAKAMGVQTGRRTVFLDNDQSPDKIAAQLDLLVRLAGEHGQAIGIGHPYPATLEALRRYQIELRSRTKMVEVSRLVH